MRIDRRSFMRLVGAYPALSLMSGRCLANSEQMPVETAGSEEDTTIVLSGEYGYEQKSIRDRAKAIIDARTASFTIASSKNPYPNAILGCDVGWLPVNRYPVVIRNCPAARFIGGRFNGEVSLTSDREHSYCNSAALLVRDGTAKATVESVRVRRCWDGIRFSEGSKGFCLKGSWLSEVRDDAVENDYLVSGIIEDCLLDGCFAGISLDPGSRDRDGTRETVTIDRLLLRMHGYLADGEVTHQAPIKADELSPKLKITGSVFALSAANMRGSRRLERAWQKITESRDNTLLWLSDEPLPSGLQQLPGGFSVLAGAAAREYWNKARQGWIDAHPDVPRFSDEKA